MMKDSNLEKKFYKKLKESVKEELDTYFSVEHPIDDSATLTTEDYINVCNIPINYHEKYFNNIEIDLKWHISEWKSTERIIEEWTCMRKSIMEDMYKHKTLYGNLSYGIVDPRKVIKHGTLV